MWKRRKTVATKVKIATRFEKRDCDELELECAKLAYRVSSHGGPLPGAMKWFFTIDGTDTFLAPMAATLSFAALTFPL